jgi:monoamine oxidase
VEGGNDRLAKGLAAGLDLRLNSPVRRIGPGWVGTDDGDLDADHIVVAVPLPILKRPGFLVDPPASLRGAIDTIHMGTAAKAVVATVEEPPMFRRQEPDIPGWYWTGADADGSTRRAVTGFAGTARGTRALTADSKQRVARAVPETELVGNPLVVDWGLDPWAGGCYSALGPGQHSLLEPLRAPAGRVVFAGEHVNGSGTIDGAIRSGIDAARLTMESI